MMLDPHAVGGIVSSRPERQKIRKCADALEMAAPPAPPPPTAEEIADSIVEQLAQAFYEVRDKINVADLRAAFDRRFGASEIAEERSRAALADADGLEIPDFLRRAAP